MSFGTVRPTNDMFYSRTHTNLTGREREHFTVLMRHIQFHLKVPSYRLKTRKDVCGSSLVAFIFLLNIGTNIKIQS